MWANGSPSTSPPNVRNVGRATSSSFELVTTMSRIGCASAATASQISIVVAHEVKALAGQTAKATEEIGQNVGLIQSSTKNAVDAVREIGGAVHEINAITSTIAGAIEQQDAATREISANAQSAAQGNETLVSNINSLREAIGRPTRPPPPCSRPPTISPPRPKRCRARWKSSSKTCARGPLTSAEARKPDLLPASTAVQILPGRLG